MFLPKNLQERMAYLFMVASIPWIALFELLYVMPHRYHSNCTHEPVFWLHFTLGLFLIVNIAGNLHRFITNSSSIHGVFLSSLAKPEWRYCTLCECRCPPRSYHCFVCNICILKRDHHCMFTGSCVGHSNQRFYLGTILHFTLAALYASFFNLPHTVALLSPHHSLPSLLFVHTFPLLAYLVGSISLLEALVTFTTSLCLIGAVLLVALFAFHASLALNNRTVHERAHLIHDYDQKSWKANLSHVFGSRGPLLCFLCPFLDSKLPSEGLSFPTNEGAGFTEIMKER